MTIPSATYRLQFRNGMTFDTAIDLVPYLTDLGISHLYASPIFTATAGSSHGYDIVDANAVDPVLGGRPGFDRMSEALQRAGLGLILDIVPNHMAASVENPWWADVLRRGKASRYAGTFDIDWRERLTLPVLGRPLKEAIAAGELKLVRNTDDGTPALLYGGTCYPLRPDGLADGVPDSSDTGANDAHFQSLLRDPERMMRLLERQHWQFTFWKEASRHLTYRRFFEVTGLVGMRVEDEDVFHDTHRLILELVDGGQVEGLRVDHIDGLADPTGYLNRLRAAVGAQTYLTVEKILGVGEVPPARWPVAGTTGYEFISAVSHLFMDKNGFQDLQGAYRSVDAEAADVESGLRKAKQLMVERNFEGEVDRLVRLAQSVAPAVDRQELKESVQELLIAFPVYRTYGGRGALSTQDKAVLETAIGQAERHLRAADALDLVNRLLRGEIDGAAAFEFRTRFQQASGPVMAKALEDTLFYRFNRLLAANEVGGEPAQEPGGVPAFDRAMLERHATQPTALSATSTHDTKRGEDARARLYTLCEAPLHWSDAVQRWRDINRPSLVSLTDGLAPEPNVEWMLYQALAGIWPSACEPVDLDDAALEILQSRLTRYAQKAVREAKSRTNWSAPNDAYEKAVMAYAEALLSPANRAFLLDFDRTMQPFAAAGFINTLSQTLIKLMAPGVPDIYQGAEGFDFSLVDPDNRQKLDFQKMSAGPVAGDGAGRRTPEQRKRHLIRNGLHLRRENATLFMRGNYLPLETSGRREAHVVAFARILDGSAVVTIVPRLVLGCVDTDTVRISPAFWQDTVVLLPPGVDGLLYDPVSGLSLEGRELPVSTVLSEEDVAVLVRDPVP